MAHGTFRTAYEGPEGRILVSDSLSYCDDRVGADDVVVGASFAGAPTVGLALVRGVKGVIAHAAGVGKGDAGVSGLPLADRFGIPAAAVDTMSARVSDGESLFRGTISHANKAARILGVWPGQGTEKAARIMLDARPGKPAELSGMIDDSVHEVERTERGRIYAVWSISLVKEPHPADVFCLASHSGTVMADYVIPVRPKGVIANDAGFAMDHSGVAGIEALDGHGISACAVDCSSARIGDARSTYDDGIVSFVNRTAESAGVRTGMPAREAARIMLGG